MDLDSFLIERYVIVDDWVQLQADRRPAGRGRPARLSLSEVLTLAILQQWPRWRSERDFGRWADRHLRPWFPHLVGQSQLNRRIRQAHPQLAALQRALAAELTQVDAVFRLLDTTLVPAMHRVRAGRHGCFAGEASFGRCASKTAWVYGFKLGLITDPAGVITTFGVAPGNAGERQVGDAVLAQDRYRAYLADKGFQGQHWEQHWLADYGAVVAATPKAGDKRTLTPALRRWSASHRQRIEGVIAQLKDLFGLDRHRAKQLDGLLVRITSKIAAYTCGQAINRRLGRPLCQLADLLL
jgi:IS5 family transposase